MAEQEKTSTNGDATKATSTKDASAQAARAENGGNSHTESGLSLAAPQEAKGGMQVSSYAVAGLRPIASSNLEIFGTILNNRPVSVSSLRVVNYAGNRPIFASEIAVHNDFAGRPIMVSDPSLLKSSLLPGGRPIASNTIDDGESLMGFID